MPGRSLDASDHLRRRDADGGEREDVEQEREERRCAEWRAAVEVPASEEQGLATRLAEAQDRHGQTRERVVRVLPAIRPPEPASRDIRRLRLDAVPRHVCRLGHAYMLSRLPRSAPAIDRPVPDAGGYNVVLVEHL